MMKLKKDVDYSICGRCSNPYPIHKQHNFIFYRTAEDAKVTTHFLFCKALLPHVTDGKRIIHEEEWNRLTKEERETLVKTSQEEEKVEVNNNSF